MGNGVRRRNFQGYPRSDFLNLTGSRYLADFRKVTPTPSSQDVAEPTNPIAAAGIWKAVSHEIPPLTPPKYSLGPGAWSGAGRPSVHCAGYPWGSQISL